jgi:hypothetical protein
VLLSLGLVDRTTKVSGASSGSLGAVLLKCGFDAADVLRSTLVRLSVCGQGGLDLRCVCAQTRLLTNNNNPLLTRTHS